jgi:hypothetical protein
MYCEYIPVDDEPALDHSRHSVRVHASSNTGYNDSQFRVHSFPTPYPPSAPNHSPMPPLYGSQPSHLGSRGQTFIQQQNPTFGYQHSASVQTSGQHRPHTTLPSAPSFPVHTITPMTPQWQNHYNAQIPSHLGHSDYTAPRALQNFPTPNHHHTNGSLANHPANSAVPQNTAYNLPYSQHRHTQF